MMGAHCWSSFLCIRVYDWEEMINHPDKIVLSAQIEGSAEESSGNLQYKRSCQCLVQLNSKNSKAEAPFTSGCIHTDNSKGDIFWQILDFSLYLREKKKIATNFSGLCWQNLQIASSKMSRYSSLFSMPFLALGEKEQTPGRFFMGEEGGGLGWQELQ